ncbi:diguanylate cyclase [Aromatoleum petrolei]|uniref:Diguanylate cyclase n=2 Tax=Aromatoleum petrolei TaxID=76116 RepID=A0ABX1MKE5_9RHOO|nr:diguanylate cyclase [Aromatoleum petrolei]
MLDTTFLVDPRGRIVYVNAACQRMFGYAPEELIGQLLFDYLAPDDRARTQEEARHVMAGCPRVGFENRYLRKDGRYVNVMWSACWSAEDQLRIGVARDVTHLKRTEAIQHATYAISEAAHNATDLDGLLRQIHQIVARLVPVAGLAIATCDRRTKELSFSYQMDRDGSLPVLDEPLACQFCAQVICGGRPMRLPDTMLRARSGEALSRHDRTGWLAIPLIAQHETIGVLVLKSDPETHHSDEDRGLLHFVSEQVAIAIDRAQMKDELLRAARYDELTGLPNRRLFKDRINSAVARCVRSRGSMAVLYIDVDDFKQVNDALGHATGDLLLKDIARRLQLCVRGADTVARLGGDEFVVLLEGVATQGDAQLVVVKIRDAMLPPLDIGGQSLRIQLSIGVALYPEHGQELEQLLKHADEAMYSDKRNTGAVLTYPAPPNPIGGSSPADR